MNHRNITLAALAGATLLAPVTLSAQTKVGFVYVSPVGDAGWSFQHDLGRKEMEKALGNKITTKVVENVPEGADAERVITNLAREGCKVIFTTSFGYMEPTLKVARLFPDVKFFHATGYKTAANVDTYNARFYEGRYLNGIVAGRMTKSHIVGYVAAFPIPEVIQGINAFTLGMRSVDPKAEVRVVWVNSWFDPGKEREATLSLINQGADMVTHHTDSTAVVTAAEEMHKKNSNIYAFAYNSDMAKYGPNCQLSGTTHIWGGYYTKTLKDIMAGTFKASGTWGGFREHMIDTVPYGKAVPKAVRDEVDKRKAELVKGTLHPFAGPVVEQGGTVKVAKGKVMSDSDIGAMHYYVQGVAGSLPK